MARPLLVLLASLALLPALGPTQAESLGTGCSAEGVTTCVFSCEAGETVHVWARSGFASDLGGETVVATATCGGATAACADVANAFEHAECGASSRTRTLAAGVGVCEATGAATEVACWSA